MQLVTWPCSGNEEYALRFGPDEAPRVLVLPALFDEGNRLRRLTVQTMRLLAAAGIASVLPDLPGCNESKTPLQAVSIADWRGCAEAACAHFAVTHVLAVRGGALIVPAGTPGWDYAPVPGASIVRQLLRVRILSSREAGREETQASLIEAGAADGLELAGYRLSTAMLTKLQDAVPDPARAVIAQGELGGAGLWLRAEPGEDSGQADALAARIVADMTA